MEHAGRSRDARLATPSPPGEGDDVARRLAARDPSAFERLYDQSSGAVYRIAHAIVRDASLAETVLEEVFLALWHQPEAFMTPQSALGESLAAAVRSRASEHLPG